MAKETPAAEAAPIALSLVPRTAVPSRSQATAAKVAHELRKVAEKAARDEMAAPIVAGMINGEAVTDNVTYPTSTAAQVAGQRAKRLVTDLLTAAGLRGSARVFGTDEAGYTWFLVTLPLKVKEVVVAK